MDSIQALKFTGRWVKNCDGNKNWLLGPFSFAWKTKVTFRHWRLHKSQSTTHCCQGKLVQRVVGSFEVENNIQALKVTLKVRAAGSFQVENDVQTLKTTLKVSQQLFGIKENLHWRIVCNSLMSRKKSCLWNAGQSWSWRWHSDVEGYTSFLRKACVWHARKSWDCRHSSIACWRSVSNWLPREPLHKVTGSLEAEGDIQMWKVTPHCWGKLAFGMLGSLRLQVTFKYCRLCWRSVTGCQGNLCTKWQAEGDIQMWTVPSCCQGKLAFGMLDSREVEGDFQAL